MNLRYPPGLGADNLFPVRGRTLSFIYTQFYLILGVKLLNILKITNTMTQIYFSDIQEARELSKGDEVSTKFFDRLESFSGFLEDTVEDLTGYSFSFVVCDLLCKNDAIPDLIEGFSTLKIKNYIQSLLYAKLGKNFPQPVLLSIAYVLAVAIYENGFRELCYECSEY